MHGRFLLFEAHVREPHHTAKSKPTIIMDWSVRPYAGGRFIFDFPSLESKRSIF